MLKRIKHLLTRFFLKVICRLYQIGNTSSRKNTKVKQLGPKLALGWVTIQVDAVAMHSVKSLKLKASGAKKGISSHGVELL